MGYYNRYGKAEVNPDAPRAFGVCDRCGFWDNLHKLKWQMQWNATMLFNTRFLVCDDCYDKPQEQLRTVILPPDPVPVANPRVEAFQQDEVNYLVTQDQTTKIITNDDVPIVTDNASENFPSED